MYIITKLRRSRWHFLGVVLFFSHRTSIITVATFIWLAHHHGAYSYLNLLAITIIPVLYLNLHTPLAINSIITITIISLAITSYQRCISAVTWTLAITSFWQYVWSITILYQNAIFYSSFYIFNTNMWFIYLWINSIKFCLDG